MDEPGYIAETMGEFPFSDKELSLWCRHLDQNCILVYTTGERGPKMYTCDGEIKPFYDFELKTYPGSIEYSIDKDPDQFRHQGVNGEVEVLDIPEKYVISCFYYDEIGQPMAFEYLRGPAISQLMSECDTNTYLLLKCLLKEVDRLNSK